MRIHLNFTNSWITPEQGKLSTKYRDKSYRVESALKFNHFILL